MFIGALHVPIAQIQLDINVLWVFKELFWVVSVNEGYYLTV